MLPASTSRKEAVLESSVHFQVDMRCSLHTLQGVKTCVIEPSRPPCVSGSLISVVKHGRLSGQECSVAWAHT